MSERVSLSHQNEPPDRLLLLRELDAEYPNISQFSLPLEQFPSHQLRKLVTYIRYSFPRFLYSKDICEFEISLMNFYLQCYHSRYLQSHSFPLESQQNQTSECYLKEETQTQTEAQTPVTSEIDLQSKNNSHLKVQEEKEGIEFSEQKNVVEIRNFLRNFAEEKTFMNYVSEQIQKSVKALQKMQISPNCILQNKTENKKTIFQRKTSDQLKKKELILGRVNSQPPKISEMIVIGEKIPIQTKMMRSQIKKMATNSFAVTSEINEGLKSELDKTKADIILVMNKLAEDNIEELFQEVQELMLNPQLAEFLIHQLIYKCSSQQQTIPINLKFCDKIRQINLKRFPKNWKQESNIKKKGHNPFHMMLVEESQKQFQSFLNSPEKMMLKRNFFLGICKTLAVFLKTLMFSKKLYRTITFSIISCIFQEIQKSQKNEKIVETLLEAMIVMIQALGTQYDPLIKKLILQQHSTIDKTMIEEIMMKKLTTESIPIQAIVEFLILIDSLFISSSERIKCLVDNMLQRRKKSTLSKNAEKSHHNNKLQKDIKKVLREVGRKTEKKILFDSLLQRYGFQLVMENILKNISDAPKEQIEENIEFLKENLIFQDQERVYFHQVYHKIYDNLIEEACEFPYLISTLAILIRMFGLSEDDFIVRKAESDQEFEEYEYFADKLSSKLQYYSEASLYQLTR